MKSSDETYEKAFRVDKVEPLVLYGFADQHLRFLEKSFPVQLIARGDTVKIKGQKEEVDQLDNILSEMVFIANKNKSLSLDDVETLVHVVKANNGAPARSADGELHGADELDEVIIFTKTGYVKPRTQGHHEILAATKQYDIVVVVGPAGTGKTYMAVALAVAALKAKLVKKIVLARPAVEAGENLGYLPGDFREKIDPYLRPLYDALDDMLPKELIKKYMEQSVIEVIPLAFMRGRTLNNAFVILDEAQNATSGQMKMFLTRLGYNSRAIINGDVTQIDLPSRAVSGLLEIKDVLSEVEGIKFILLDKSDVVRHRLVRDIIDAYDQYNNQNNQEG